MPRGLRSVSIASRIWLAAHHLCPPFSNQIIYEGSGAFEPDLWKRAVAVASASNPGARLILKGHLGSSSWADSGITPPVRLVDAHSWDGASSEHADFLYGPYAPRTGPMAEVVLIQGDPLRVAFRSHHAIMDGRGVMRWAEDIFRALRGEPVLGSDDSVTENDLLNLSRDPAASGKPIPHRYIAPTGRACGDERGIVWRRKRISGRFPRLLSQVLLLAAREAWQHASGRVRFGIPVDLRSRRPGLMSTSNLTNAIFVEITPESTIDDLAGEIACRLANRQDGHLTWEERMVPFMPLSLLEKLLLKEALQNHATGQYRFSGFVSNLGKFSMDAYQGGGFVAQRYWGVPVCLESIPFSLVMSGTANDVELILAMPRVLANGGRIEGILEEIAGNLVPDGVMPVTPGEAAVLCGGARAALPRS